MSLQISEWVYSGKDHELIGNTGHVVVEGAGVEAQFRYMGYRGITREDAMRQARMFAAAMEKAMEAMLQHKGAAVEADFMKGCA
ncbi:hypothetical protein [Cupriavidus basilensis]|uniref:hypothetical protein n=1 Tax=Cupriavidus basilensis TaxID=68895 RepID=UPI000751508E|nr:hypothetical protein [Cupriavidus basilensis]